MPGLPCGTPFTPKCPPIVCIDAAVASTSPEEIETILRQHGHECYHQGISDTKAKYGIAEEV
jgi:hypothetical protein